MIRVSYFLQTWIPFYAINPLKILQIEPLTWRQDGDVEKWECRLDVGKPAVEITLRDCFPYVIYILSRFLSLHGLLPLRALIDDHHSNLLVVFPGLTLLWLRVIAIGHLSQKHPSWLAIWQQRGRFRKAGIAEQNDLGYLIFSAFSLCWPGTCKTWLREPPHFVVFYEFANTWEHHGIQRFDTRTETWGDSEVILLDRFFKLPLGVAFLQHTREPIMHRV